MFPCSCLTVQDCLLAELPSASLSIWLLVPAKVFYQLHSALFYMYKNWSFEKNLFSEAQVQLIAQLCHAGRSTARLSRSKCPQSISRAAPKHEAPICVWARGSRENSTCLVSYPLSCDASLPPASNRDCNCTLGKHVLISLTPIYRVI